MAISGIGRDIVEKYLKRLGNSLFVDTSANGCRLITPFIRPDGEAITMQIDALPGGDLRVSDLGETVGYLYVNGLTNELAVPDYAHSIAKLYAASFLKNDLTIDGSTEELGNSVHNLVQAAIAITCFAQGRNSTAQVPLRD